MRWQSKILFLMLFFPMLLVGILFSYLSMNELAETEKAQTQAGAQKVQDEDEELNNPMLWPEERKRLREKRRLEREAQMAEQLGQTQPEENTAAADSADDYIDNSQPEEDATASGYEYENSSEEPYEEDSSQAEFDNDTPEQSHQNEYAPPAKYPEQTLEEIPIEEFQ